MPQEPIRDVGVRPDDDQAAVNRETFRVLTDLIARQAADHAAIEELKAQVS